MHERGSTISGSRGPHGARRCLKGDMMKQQFVQHVDRLQMIADYVIGLRTVMDNILAGMTECPWCGMPPFHNHTHNCEYRDVIEDYPDRIEDMIREMSACPKCHGTKSRHIETACYSGEATCPDCKGTGTVTV